MHVSLTILSPDSVILNTQSGQVLFTSIWQFSPRFEMGFLTWPRPRAIYSLNLHMIYVNHSGNFRNLGYNIALFNSGGTGIRLTLATTLGLRCRLMVQQH